MSAPAAERLTTGIEFEKRAPRAAEAIGKASTDGEVSIAERLPDLETPADVEKFLHDTVERLKLKPESTGTYEASGAVAEIARVTAAEELVRVEFAEADTELEGATGLLIDAQTIENGNPYAKSRGAVVKVAATVYEPDGTLSVERIHDPEKEKHAIKRIAGIVSEIASDPEESVREAPNGDWDHQQRIFKLESALRGRNRKKVEL